MPFLITIIIIGSQERIISTKKALVSVLKKEKHIDIHIESIIDLEKLNNKLSVISPDLLIFSDFNQIENEFHDIGPRLKQYFPKMKMLMLIEEGQFRTGYRTSRLFAIKSIKT